MRFLFLLLFLASCAQHRTEQLTSIQLTDRSGFQETISSGKRLEDLSKSDFDEAQPYEKIVRTYDKVRSIVSSYHDNGYLYQSLGVISGRAQGTYLEYHENGTLHIESTVIEGIGDLTEAAQRTWLFDGESSVYDDEGRLEASILYDKGKLAGISRHYFPSGQLKKEIPYSKGLVDGVIREFDESGQIIAEAHYVGGVQEGKSYVTGEFEEEYIRGKLIDAKYFGTDGKLVSAISHGKGWVSRFDQGVLQEQRECTAGIIDGQVKIYSDTGDLSNTYIEKEGEKHGEEIVFYPMSINAKLSIQWYEGEVHGKVRTWYPSGKQESEREVSHNQKEGISLAWYETGDLMLMEEYEADTLMEGKYYKVGTKEPISRIIRGNGLATLYDKDGILIQKVRYEKGKVIHE